MPGAFADDEAVAILVEGPAGARRIVVSRRERAHGREAADTKWRDGRLGPAGDHHVGVAALDDLGRLADGVRGRGARRAGGQIRPTGAEPDRHLPGREIDDGRGNEEGRDAARPPFEQLAVFALDGAEPADARRDVHADVVGVGGGNRKPSVADGEVRRGDRELNEDVHLLDVFLFEELQRVERLDLARDARGKLRGVEVRNRSNAALAAGESPPVRLGPDAD